MELVKCPFCGKEIESDSFYCDQCGATLMLCPSGHGFKKGKVCSDCGTKLVEAKGAANSPTQPATPSPSPAPAATQPQSTNVQPQVTNTARQPEPVAQPADPEKTVRPVAAPAEPQFLISTNPNACLALKDGAIIGRRTGDYVQVFGNQGYISGTHARVQKNTAGAWEIVDLGSTNGTFLNGQKLVANQPAVFKIDDTIAFYDLKFIVASGEHGNKI